MSFANRANLDIIEDQYQRWRRDPASVDERWQAFFEGFELAGRTPSPAASQAQTGVVRLIYAYRDLGHFQAHLDPLNPPPGPYPLLQLSNFGLSDADLDRPSTAVRSTASARSRCANCSPPCNETYCRTIGVEYMHIQDTNVRRWLQRADRSRGACGPNLPLRQKLRILMTLHYAELFERFLHTRYQGQKRFSLEGAETLIPVLDAIGRESGRRSASRNSSWAWPIAAGSTCWPTSCASRTRKSSPSSRTTSCPTRSTATAT